jgi:hypothetical protein
MIDDGIIKPETQILMAGNRVSEFFTRQTSHNFSEAGEL